MYEAEYLVGTLLRGYRCAYCATSLGDLDLTFDLVVVTISFKSSMCYFLDSVRCRRQLVGTLVRA